MNWQGNVIMFGSIILIIAGIIFGAFIAGGSGKFVLSLSIVAAIVWIGFVFHIASTMNSDL